MNMILATLVFLVIIFTTTYAWIVLTPVFYQVLNGMSSVVSGMVSGDASSTLTFWTSAGSYIWLSMVVVFCLGFLLWLYLAAHKKDPESYLEVPR
jgi:hypothetical protein